MFLFEEFEVFAEVLGLVAEALFDAHKLVVFADAVGTAGGAGLDEAGVESDDEVGNGGVLSLAGTVGDDGGVTIAGGKVDSVDGLGEGANLVELNKDGVGHFAVKTHLQTPEMPIPDEPEFDQVRSEVSPVEYEPEETIAPIETVDNAAPDEKSIEETVSEVKAVWPVEGDIQRDYSIDALQYDPTMSDWRTHDGVDLSGESGTKVLAVQAGTVLRVCSDDLYGTTVVIDHGNGLVISYANLEEIPTVYEGDSVSAGDVIGSIGETAKCESSQESHLHLSAELNGESVSPLDYLPKKT